MIFSRKIKEQIIRLTRCAYYLIHHFRFSLTIGSSLCYHVHVSQVHTSIHPVVGYMGMLGVKLKASGQKAH